MDGGGKLFLRAMPHHLELRNLRSLERKSMYSIFHPLDPNERLPRELILEGRRHRWFAQRTLFGLVGTLYLPGLILTIVVLGSLNLSLVFAFAIAGVVLALVFVYVLAARQR